MIIVLETGTQKFPFDRLVRAADRIAAEHPGVTILAQTGTSAYVPTSMKSEAFISQDAMTEWVNSCDLVLTHGGTGSIVSALKKSKHVVAVARLSRYGEHVDDHQTEIIEEFDNDGLITGLTEFSTESLWNAILKEMARPVQKYPDRHGDLMNELKKRIDQC